MREVHRPDISKEDNRYSLPTDTWLPLGDVAAALALGAATWPERPGPRGRRQAEGGQV